MTNFAAYFHQQYSTPLVGIAEVTLLWYWYTLTPLPGFVIGLTFKKIRNVFMYNSLLHIIHGFECLGRDAVKARCFSLLEFGNGTFDLLEGDRGVNVDEAWLLGSEFKDGVINWSVVIED